MSTSVTIGLAQWDIRDGEPDKNVGMLQKMGAMAKQKKTDLLLVPEMWYTGYDYAVFSQYASAIREGAFAVMGETAKDNNLAICGTSVRQENDRFFNTMAFFDQNGELQFFYDKIHLFAPMGEVDHLTHGNQVMVKEWYGLRVGPAICYDLRFPELFRKQIRQNLQLILISAQWPKQRIKHWELLLRARAIENQCFIAGCNRIGEKGDTIFTGQSAIVAPNGETLVQTDASEGVWIETIHLNDLFDYRRSLPYLKDIRDDI